VLVLGRGFDTSQWRLRTNTFQAFDMGLTVGTNQITLHAMDWAGNQTNCVFVYLLDYTGKTNPPVVQIYWPSNGALLCGSNFTCRGVVDDPTLINLTVVSNAWQMNASNWVTVMTNGGYVTVEASLDTTDTNAAH